MAKQVDFGSEPKAQFDSERFKIHDAAAMEITAILQAANIKHVFIGGYAVSFVRAHRVPQDVDVVSREDCIDLLLERECFARTEDKRLSFKHEGETIYIDVMTTKWNLDGDIWFTDVCPSEHPERGIETMIKIMHPRSLVLMKMLPWHAATQATRKEYQIRLQSDLQDIHVLLQWLDKQNMKIDLAGQSTRSRPAFDLIVGKLYAKYDYLRPSIAKTITPGQLMAALAAAGISAE